MMFENVESKLKTFAKFNSVCAFIIVFILLVVVSKETGGRVTALGAFVYLFLSVIITYGLISICWLMYAFAEIAENTKKTNESLRLALSRNIYEDEQRKKDADAVEKAVEAAKKAAAEKAAIG